MKPASIISNNNHTSRRAAMGGLAALLSMPLVASPGRAQTPAPDSVPADPLPADIATRSDATDRLTIEVHINGTGPYRFIVDTGAERSVIADTLAADLGLVPIGRVVVDGITNQIPADLVAIQTLAFGPFSLGGMHLPVLPRQFLLVDGYLGLDVINGNRVTFDFKQHLLRIDTAKTRLPAPIGDTTIVATRGTAGRLRAGRCWVDGVSVAGFVDTGAEVSMGNSALYAALVAHRSRFQDLGSTILTGVTGGQTLGKIIAVNTVNLQDMRVDGSMLAISDSVSFDAWGLRDKPALLLGMNFLRAFARVSIDYRHAEIRFELGEATPVMVAQT